MSNIRRWNIFSNSSTWNHWELWLWKNLGWVHDDDADDDDEAPPGVGSSEALQTFSDAFLVLLEKTKTIWSGKGWELANTFGIVESTMPAALVSVFVIAFTASALVLFTTVMHARLFVGKRRRKWRKIGKWKPIFTIRFTETAQSNVTDKFLWCDWLECSQWTARRETFPPEDVWHGNVFLACFTALCHRDGFNPSSPLPLIFLHERSWVSLICWEMVVLQLSV